MERGYSVSCLLCIYNVVSLLTDNDIIYLTDLMPTVDTKGFLASIIVN